MRKDITTKVVIVTTIVIKKWITKSVLIVVIVLTIKKNKNKNHKKPKIGMLLLIMIIVKITNRTGTITKKKYK